MKKVQLAYIYGLTAIILWSTVAVAFKTALRYMDFMQLLFFSSLISTLLFIIFLIAKNEFSQLFKYSTKDYFNSALLGLLNPFGYYLVLLKAYSVLPAQLAQPLNYTWPIMMVILSIPILKQKLIPKSFIAIFISFLGVYIISSRDSLFNLKVEQPSGIFLAVSSSVIWALFWIFNTKDKRPDVHKLGLAFTFSLIYTSIFVYFFSDFKLPPLNGIFASLYIGLFEMGFTFILWLKALQMSERNDKLSNLAFISPFMSLFWIHLILNEKIYHTTIIGLILIILGIFVQQFRYKRKNG